MNKIKLANAYDINEMCTHTDTQTHTDLKKTLFNIYIYIYPNLSNKHFHLSFLSFRSYIHF